MSTNPLPTNHLSTKHLGTKHLSTKAPSRRPFALLLAAAALLVPLTACGSDTPAPSPPAATAAGTSGSAGSDASSASASATTSASANASESSSGSSASGEGYAMTEVATHDSEESCWAAVDGSVYDLTSWIAKHPGGPDRIKGLCGTDATEKFKAQHNTAEKPNAMLATFKIGELTG